MVRPTGPGLISERSPLGFAPGQMILSASNAVCLADSVCEGRSFGRWLELDSVFLGGVREIFYEKRQVFRNPVRTTSLGTGCDKLA